MADLRKRFIEDYAGGLLNIARQELSTTGEVLAQDGLTSEGTLFVEDGTGTKSGLRLGVSLAEVVDPTTEQGAVNVRYSDRTYAKIRDLKIFSTAIASAQAALSEATTVSISNIETTLQLLEDDINTIEQNFQQNVADSQQQLQKVSLTQQSLTDTVAEKSVALENLTSRVTALEVPNPSPTSVSVLDTTLNSFYYTGTISTSGTGGNVGVVTGVGSSFDTQLDVGDIFVAFMATGEEVEFRVASFDTVSPQTIMSVTPTNKALAAGTKFSRGKNFELKSKVNEILTVLKSLKLIV